MHGNEQKNWIGRDERIAILGALDSFFSQSLGVKAKARVHFDYGTTKVKLEKREVISIEAKGNYERDELYLRCGIFEGNERRKQLIVARIGFRTQRQRKGFGTLLLLILCTIAEQFKYEIISIEAPNRECQAFCKRIGFPKNYKLKRKTLRTKLEKYIASKSTIE